MRYATIAALGHCLALQQQPVIQQLHAVSHPWRAASPCASEAAAVPEEAASPDPCAGLSQEDLDALPELGQGKNALPERFGLKLRALRGEFSPKDAPDTERDENSITKGLIGFPALLPVKVVSQKLDAEAQVALVEDLRKVCDACYVETGLYASTEFEVTQRMGGAIASIAFTVRVPSSDALTVLREEIKSDKRVKMVF